MGLALPGSLRCQPAAAWLGSAGPASGQRCLFWRRARSPGHAHDAAASWSWQSPTLAALPHSWCRVTVAQAALSALVALAATPAGAFAGRKRPRSRFRARKSLLLRRAERRAPRAPNSAEKAVEFGGIDLHGAPARWIRRSGLLNPTPIQAKAMEALLEGASAALCAPTGTGKTLAYLLPLIERFQIGRSSSSAREGEGRLLIVVPIQDLQLQVSAVARALLGGAQASSNLVFSPYRNVSVGSEGFDEARIVVATQSQLEDISLLESWPAVAAEFSAVVLDEADAMRARFEKVLWLLEDLQALRGGGLQIVTVSASLDAGTVSYFSAVAEGGGRPFCKLRVGVGGDDDGFDSNALNLWPSTLRHSYYLFKNGHQPLYRKDGTLDMGSMDTVGKILYCLEPAPQRCLVLFSGSMTVTETGGRLKGYAKRLKRVLMPAGFTVASVSAVVETQAATTTGAAPPWAPRTGGRQVILDRGEAIRGIDIPGIDVVVIVGRVETAKEYRHLAGRTARYNPGSSAQAGGRLLEASLGRASASGHAISLCDAEHLRRLRRWGEEAMFSVEKLVLAKNEHIEVPKNYYRGRPMKRRRRRPAAAKDPEGGWAPQRGEEEAELEFPGA